MITGHYMKIKQQTQIWEVHFNTRYSYVRPAIKAQSHSSIETPSDTFTDLNRNIVSKLNFNPDLPLSTKRSLYNNKENLPEQSKELNNLESIILIQIDSSLSTEQLECQPLDTHSKHQNNNIPELTPIAKYQELKQPINLLGSVCIECANNNFISVKGINQSTVKDKNLYVVMEKDDTDISKLIRSTKNMSVHMIMYFWTEILTTVSVIHSDLKPANFLLMSGRLKLIDFCIASKIQGDMSSVLKDVTTGTWNYISPECIRSGGSNFEGHKINQKSGVWSSGCIFYSLVYGKTPYSHLTNTWQKLQFIAESKQNINFSSHSKVFTEGVPLVLQQTMQLCLKKDVKVRPYVIDLLKLIEDSLFKPMTI
ncbi:hypothetical protein QTP88_023286 [Uroleucon formosanum]